MTDSTVRFGLLGAAAITPLAMVTPAREVDGVSLDVIAARDPARAQEFAETHGIHRVSEHYQAVIDDPAEVTGVDPHVSKHGQANVHWMIRWDSREAREERWQTWTKDPGWGAIWAKHPNPSAYLQMNVRYMTTV